MLRKKLLNDIRPKEPSLINIRALENQPKIPKNIYGAIF